MPRKVTIQVPLNRVEGDLEIKVNIEGGVVADAWCSGTMFRGFERLLVGRGALDGLVITPRICGICSTSHLLAAAKALDGAGNAPPPPDAARIRNVATMAEHVQSDIRHAALVYAADFVNGEHCDQPLHEEALRRYTPYSGQAVVEVIRETKRLLEVVAILGGQWPHSTFMVPGGIASVPSAVNRAQCRLLLRQFRTWYEGRILGCSIERIAELDGASALDDWLDERPEHAESELGFFVRFGRAIGLETMGQSHDSFLSFGSFDLPEGTAVRGRDSGSPSLVAAGFAKGGDLHPFDEGMISEHVAHSWFEDYEGGLHPSKGQTRPYASGRESLKYSWAKAPRYQDVPAETGPLAELIIGGHPLIRDLVSEGASAFSRQLARILRPAELLPAMESWLTEVSHEGELYLPAGDIDEGEGVGMTEAARGALGHWVKIRDGRIDHYQVITPTAWNASPRDGRDVRGPIEEALVGTRIRDLNNPVELGHVVRSFDPCLVCTVHAVSPAGAGPIGKVTIAP